MKKVGMCLMGLGMTLCAWAQSFVVYNPAPNPMLEDENVKTKLFALAQEAGYQPIEVRDAEELAAQFAGQTPDILVWGPAEAAEKSQAEFLRRTLAGGGMVVTGGGAPFYYLTEDHAIVEQGPGVGVKLTGIGGAFANAPHGKITAAGQAILGISGECAALNRGGVRPKDPSLVWLPLVEDGDNTTVATVFLVGYPGNGRFFYYGSNGLAHNEWFNPLTENGAANWRKILAHRAQALPQLSWSQKQREFRNDGKLAATATLKLANPQAQPLTVSGVLSARPAPGFGRSGETMALGDFNLTLAPESTQELIVKPQFSLTQWGVYEVEAQLANGMTTRCTMQILPPGAVDFIDVDPMYAYEADLPRTLTVGLNAFVEAFEGRLRVLLVAENRVLYDQPVKLTQTPETVITSVRIPLDKVERDLLVRAELTDRDGAVIHDASLRVEASAANPALLRRDIMFRAMNGSQFESEAELPADLEAMRDRTPLLRGLYMHSITQAAREWMHDHDFTLNYGLLLTNFPNLGYWGLDDCNAAGRSAMEFMDGHAEDPAKWLVWQHSRMHFTPLLAMKPEIVNLVEAVAGYQAPGSETPAENLVEGEYANMSDVIAGRRPAPEEMAGKVSHFLGYAPEAVWRHREALDGRDGGLRILEPGGKSYRRIHLAELYADLFDEPMPEAQEVGFASWAEYQPIPLLLSHENGYFANDTELKRYQLHYLLRCYFHLKRLDDLSAYLRSFAPEIHCVIGHDGPLAAQLSDVLYRLPYLDTQTRWLFRSAYVMAIDTTFGAERHWVDLGKLYGKRVGIHEEIGGGQWASYRTEETSFVSLFTKRAALDYRDLQVDFYHNREKTYRVAEELAMFRGFQFAVDSGAVAANADAELLVVETNNSHYPANYQGNFRWDLMMPPEPILSVPAMLRANGREFHSTHTPLFAERQLRAYRVLWLAAERYRKGDLKLVREWLDSPEPGPRTLVLNHTGTMHADYLSGFSLHEINVRKPEAWQVLGLPTPVPEKAFARELRGADGVVFTFDQPLPVLLTAMPSGAQPVLSDESGRAVVWSWEREPQRRILYSGLPLNNLFESAADSAVFYAACAKLLDACELPRRYAIEPAGWFGMGYALNDGTLAVALINPAEYKVAMSPHGGDGDAVEAATAALGESEVTYRWEAAAAPGTTFQVYDAWDDADTGIVVTADAQGTIELRVKVVAARLLLLRSR